MLFVSILPILGVLVYIIVQGDNMPKREVENAAAVERAQRAYIRDAAGDGSAPLNWRNSPVSGTRGVLSDAEFQTQKDRLLA